MASNTVAAGASRPRSTPVGRSLVTPLLIAAIALLPIVLSLPFLSEPMEQDEAVYFTVAQHGWPYGEIFDHKPPVVYGWYKLALLSNGGDPSIEAARSLAAVSLAITALAVTWTGAMLFDRRTGYIAGVLAGLAATNQYLQFNANSEVFLLAPLALSLGTFVRGWRTGSLGWFALSGALAGLAAMTKSVAALHLLALAGTLIWAGTMQLTPWRPALRGAATVLASGAATALLIAAPFVVIRGDSFWYANVTYNIAYSAQVGFEDKLFAITEVDRYALLAGLYLWVPAAVGAVLLCRRGASMAAALLISGAGAAFIGASATGREYPHYLVTLLPFVCLLAAFTLARMSEDWGRTRSRLHTEALLVALAIPAIFAVVPLYVLDIDAVHLRKYHQGPNARRAIESESVAIAVRNVAPSGGTLFVLGDDAQLYVLSGLAPVTHHLRPVSDAAVDRGTWAQTMRELEQAPPDVIVDAARIELGVGLLGREGQTVELDIPQDRRAQFDEFLRRHGYEVAQTAGYATILRLSD